MSGKFMKIKRIVIPTLTMVIIASQLMGCSAATQDELLTMLNNGDAIEIEVAAPINQEQGETKQIEWIKLDQLDNYEDFRKEFDDILKISAYGQDSKMGVAYVDLEGNQEGNNTLYNAFMNRKFISTYWDNETTQEKVQDSVLSLYTDVDEDSKAVKYAALNAYWNLLPDAEPNYFNGDSTLSRGEAMALVMRAETQVTEDGKPESFVDFTSAVGTAQDDYTDFAGYLMEDSYLTVDSQSLDDLTYKGTITRGEYVYLLMNHYFSDTLKNVDTSKVKFTDTKNAGNIAATQKYIENATEKPRWQSYELTYAIRNVDSGCPERMYKALACAAEVGVLENNGETRWDEGLTKTEAIELLVNTFEAYTRINGYKVDAMQGAGTGESLIDDSAEVLNKGGSMTSENVPDGDELTEMNKQAAEEAEAVDETLEASSSSVITIVEELDQMMYAQKNCNARNGDGTNYDKVASIEKSAYLHVTGRTSNDWYRVEWEGVEDGEIYISGSLLGLTKPTSDSGNNNNSGNGNSGSTNNGGSGSNNNGGNSGGGQYSQEEVNNIMDSIFGEGTGNSGGPGNGSGALIIP